MCKEPWKVQNLFGLPLELQFRIISYLDIRGHIRLRKVDEEFKLLSNLYWRSELKKLVFGAETTSFRTTEDSLMQALKISTEVYVQNGYETAFWDCLLAYVVRKEQRSLYHMTKSTFQEFLLKFYKYMDRFVYSEFPQYLRSLYAMQVLHLLKCFPTSQLSFRTLNNGLNICFEIEDVWLGASYEIFTTDKLEFLPIALAELTYSYNFQRTTAFANIHKGFCYTYGYEFKERRRHFRTEFNVFIDGTEELKCYIKAWLSSPDDFVYFPRRVFIEYFRFGLKIEVKGFVKNFFPQRILLELD